jgi:hypothetical protein
MIWKILAGKNFKTKKGKKSFFQKRKSQILPIIQKKLIKMPTNAESYLFVPKHSCSKATILINM